MFKRSLLISTVALCASLSFAQAQTAPSAGTVSALASCSSNCVEQAQTIAAEINALPAGPEKDDLILSLVKAAGTLAINDPALSVALGDVVASTQAGLSADAAAAAPFVEQVVAALQAGTPGTATAALGRVRGNPTPGLGNPNPGLGNPNPGRGNPFGDDRAS